jgi:Rad3-related DNA helicase
MEKTEKTESRGMLRPGDLGLPFDSWTPGQFDVIAQVASHLAQPDTPPVLLEAPTGSGKSAIAVAVAHLVNRLGRTVVLTGTRQLQDQYVETFGDTVRSVMGRANFPCALDRSRTAADADCTVGFQCHLKSAGCEYFLQRDAALDHREVVTNYQYWLAQANYAHRLKADLLVCDEAHILEDEVRRFASVAIRDSHVSRALGWPPPSLKRIAAWRSWCAQAAAALYPAYQEAEARKMDLTPSERRTYQAVISLFRACQQLLSDPEATDDGWIVEHEAWGTNLRPVWVRPYFQKYVAQHARKIFLMSATVLSKEVFAWTLGLPDDAVFVRAPSRFPVENRPLYYAPVGRVKGGQALAPLLTTLVGAVDDIMDRHADERGLIHTVSYEIARAIFRLSRHRRRLVTHDNQTRTDALNRLKIRPGTVLVSPSMATGVDLPYDLCRFQVICKLAFPYLGDPQVKKRMKLGPDGQPDPRAQRWYNWATACALVQTYGRGVRAIDDACVTYLLDGNYAWWKHVVKDMLPDWFTSAVKPAGPVHANQGTDIDAILRQYRRAPLASAPS